ncbi:GNAT family N-acetyltransferase [Affinibrenneria salicis]|uniref:GNAT family N-acetyltransferase n=1 Tax=Affinibrenneria salicis TaxID=2590031 RepID=A0A5J5FVL3_9GAMM|nr:GNAT family N-acetyltransferase [Affinibrenneria salicis]KAA8996900.1 GNAT family N-acetyltransferase [Affinibrenneria salicis]
MPYYLSLREAADLLHELSRHLHDEWRDFAPWRAPNIIADRLWRRCQSAGGSEVMLALDPPRTLLATASIIRYELADRPEREWWLGEVYTLPAQRGHGVASRLIRACVLSFRQRQPADIWLYTPDCQRFYRRLGWQEVEQREVQGERVSVMVLPASLTPAGE